MYTVLKITGLIALVATGFLAVNVVNTGSASADEGPALEGIEVDIIDPCQFIDCPTPPEGGDAGDFPTIDDIEVLPVDPCQLIDCVPPEPTPTPEPDPCDFVLDCIDPPVLEVDPCIFNPCDDDGGDGGDDTPKDTPDDTPDDTPQDTPDDTPDDTPEDTPQDTPEDTPQDTPSKSGDPQELPNAGSGTAAFSEESDAGNGLLLVVLAAAGAAVAGALAFAAWRMRKAQQR